MLYKILILLFISTVAFGQFTSDHTGDHIDSVITQIEGLINPTESPSFPIGQGADSTWDVVSQIGFKDTLDISLSVLDFGAVGDGSADDATAINDAIDSVSSLGGGIVIFPENHTFILEGRILKKTDVSLVGYGAIIKLQDGLNTDAVSLIECEAGDHAGTGIYGLELDGNVDNNLSYEFADAGHGIFTAEATPGTGAVVGTAENVTIQDVYIHDVLRSLIVAGGKGHLINNVRLENSFLDHFLYFSASQNCIANNILMTGYCGGGSMITFALASPEDSPLESKNNIVNNVNIKDIVLDKEGDYPGVYVQFRDSTFNNVINNLTIDFDDDTADIDFPRIVLYSSSGIYESIGSGINNLHYRGRGEASGMIIVGQCRDAFINGRIQLTSTQSINNPVIRMYENVNNFDMSGLSVTVDPAVAYVLMGFLIDDDADTSNNIRMDGVSYFNTSGTVFRDFSSGDLTVTNLSYDNLFYNNILNHSSMGTSNISLLDQTSDYAELRMSGDSPMTIDVETYYVTAEGFSSGDNDNVTLTDSSITILKNGLYVVLLSASISDTTESGSTIWGGIFRNDTLMTDSRFLQGLSDASVQSVPISSLIQFQKNDIVKFKMKDGAAANRVNIYRYNLSLRRLK